MNEELENLRENYFGLKSNLFELLDSWYFMHNILQPRLVFTYDSIFGDLEFELDKLELNKIELDYKIRSIRFDKHFTPVAKEKSNIANYINSEAKSMSYFSNSERFSNSKDTFVFEYRELVKKIHPDVAEENEYFNQFWNGIQFAYKNHDSEQISRFHFLICKSELIEAEANYFELRKAVNYLELCIAKEQRKIQQLKKQEPFSFELLFNDTTWIEERKNIIQKKINFLERSIQTKYRLINGYSRVSA